MSGGRKATVTLERLLDLYEVEKLSLSQVAKRTGLHKSGIAVRLRRARANMRSKGGPRKKEGNRK